MKRYADGKEDRTKRALDDLLFSSEPTNERGSVTHADRRSLSEEVQAFQEATKRWTTACRTGHDKVRQETTAENTSDTPTACGDIT